MEYNLNNTLKYSKKSLQWGRNNMANQEHLDILKLGVDVWNKWREEHRDIQPDLSSADISQVNLMGADLRRANLYATSLNGANLSYANLNQADLIRVNFIVADLSYANLSRSNLSKADFSGANLSHAILNESILVRTNFTGATLTDCHIFGISVWGVELQGATQNNLVLTARDEATITVDNLEVAQFIYLLLNNPKIRDVIDTISRKAVLILGRFTAERKRVLDALRDALREHNYLPILFDFEKPSSRDLTETVRTLAHLSRFILADLTDPSSIPQELQAIVPDLEVPVQPLLLEAKREYAMFVDFKKYYWVLPVYLYKDQASLIASLKNEIIEPADKKARELAIEKAKRLERP